MARRRRRSKTRYPETSFGAGGGPAHHGEGSTKPKPDPVSGGGGLAEAYQEAQGGHPGRAAQTIAANSQTGTVPSGSASIVANAPGVSASQARALAARPIAPPITPLSSPFGAMMAGAAIGTPSADKYLSPAAAAQYEQINGFPITDPRAAGAAPQIEPERLDAPRTSFEAGGGPRRGPSVLPPLVIPSHVPASQNTQRPEGQSARVTSPTGGEPVTRPPGTRRPGGASKLAMRLSAAAGKSSPVAALVRGFVDPVTGMKLTDSPYARSIAKAAVKGQQRYGVPASVTLAVTGQESGYGTNRGPSRGAHAVGIGQGIPDTRNTQVAAGGPDFWAGDDPNDPTGRLTPAQAREQTLAASYLLGSSLDAGKSLTEALDAYTGGYGSSYNDPVNERARAFKALDKAQRAPIPAGLRERAFDELGRQQSRSIISSARNPQPPATSTRGVASPVPGKNPEIIGFPNQGTHTLGNWQSDNAIDIAVPTGTPIRAAMGGVVDKVDGDNSDPSDRFNGFSVTIGGKTFYTHLSQAKVQAGDHVSPGDVIGLSGAANGVEHLHFATVEGDPERVIGAGGGEPVAPRPKQIERFINSDTTKEITRLNPDLQTALVELAKRSGEPVQVNSGFRTYAQQAELYANRATNPYPVARPGESNHEDGNAADLALTPKQAEIAGELGLTQPEANDPVHYELANPGSFDASGGTSAATGGVSSPISAAAGGGVTAPGTPATSASAAAARAPTDFVGIEAPITASVPFAATEFNAAREAISGGPGVDPDVAAEVEAILRQARLI